MSLGGAITLGNPPLASPAVAADGAAPADPPVVEASPGHTTAGALSIRAPQGTQPVGGWITIDLSALERGVGTLLSHLDSLGAVERHTTTVARVAFLIVGIWGAYEFVRPRRRTGWTQRALAVAVMTWPGGGPWSEDGA
jgi:hypothetical protein